MYTSSQSDCEKAPSFQVEDVYTVNTVMDIIGNPWPIIPNTLYMIGGEL